MKSARYLIIFLCLLLYGSVQAEEERYKYGEVWNTWTNFNRYVYLSGFKDGMDEGWVDLERFLNRTLQTDWRLYADRYTAFYKTSISKNFPDINVVRDVMTKFYADPSNTYLEFTTIFLASVAKTRGASGEAIDKLLTTARKKSYQLHMMRKKETISTEEAGQYIKGPSFSSMVYEEIYGKPE